MPKSIFHFIFLFAGQWNFPELEIVVEPKSGLLQPGRPTLLDCSWRAARSPTVTWTKDGIPVDLATSGYIQHSNGSLSVSGGGDKSGMYQCRVSLSDVGTVLSTPATLQTAGKIQAICLQITLCQSNFQLFIYFQT